MDINATTLWAALGLILIIAEIFTVSFFLMFFGIAALIVSLLRATLGLPNLAAEILLFGLLGLSGIFIFRKKVLSSFQGKKISFSDEQQTILLDNDIPAHSEARITYQGSPWIGINDSAQDLKKGQRAVVMKTDGIKLILKLPE